MFIEVLTKILLDDEEYEFLKEIENNETRKEV